MSSDVIGFVGAPMNILRNCRNVVIQRGGVFSPWLTLLLCVGAYGQKGSLSFNRIGIDDGLSQNHVYSILQDELGFMWFGTRDGLCRYDGYEFKIYRNDPQDPYSLSANYIYSLYEDDEGYIWIGTLGGGLCRYDRRADRFDVYRHDPTRNDSLAADTVQFLAADERGYLWVATENGLDRMTLKEPGQFTHYRHDPDDDSSLGGNDVWRITIDRLGRVWAGTLGGGLSMMGAELNGRFRRWRYTGDESGLGGNDVWSIDEDKSGRLWIAALPGGLHLMEPDAIGKFKRFPDDPKLPDGVGSGRVQQVLEDSEGTIWAAVLGGGLHRLVREPDGKFRFVRYRHTYTDPTSPSHDSIWCLFEDRSGLIWFGTYGGGVNRFDPVGKGFVHYKPDPDRGGLPRGEIRAFGEAKDGSIWIGINNGGLSRFNPMDGSFRNFDIEVPGRPGEVDRSVISVLQADDMLMVGTFDGGLYLTDADQPGEFTNYRFDPDDPESLGYNEVRTIYRDRSGIFWIGTVNGGLNRMSPDKPGRFQRFVNTGEEGALSNNSILSIQEDRLGFLWVGTWGGGLNRMDPERTRFDVFNHVPGRPETIANGVIWTLFEDRDGAIWSGTSRGISRFDRDSGKFQSFGLKDGLPSEIVHGICSDSLGLMWISTNKGLAEYDPQTGQFRAYDIYDGLQGNQFFPNAHLQTSRGALLFGGNNGFNIFFPDDIRERNHYPLLAVTDFLLANQSVVSRRKDPGSPLEGSAESASHIVLDSRHNIFSFKFSVLDFAGPMANKYMYKLEPFNADWIRTTPGNRIATYTNLDAGEYTFRLKGGTKDGVWNEEGIQVKVTLLPPVWGTTFAYFFYLVAATTLIAWIVTLQRSKLAQDRELIGRLRQVDRMKDEFLANTSHELRTPLNGIIGLAESLRDGIAGELPARAGSNLEMIVSSGRRLASLVNDILDFSKLRNRGLTLRRQPLDLHALAEVVLALSRPLAAGKELVLVNEVPKELPAVFADESRLEQILHNLMGNAIKFSHKGKVVVGAAQRGEWIEVTVSDTGIGIPADKLDTIFGSFEQADASTARDFGGTGLGLPITRQLLELHGGKIDIQSEVGVGTTLSFTLPGSDESKIDVIDRERRVAHLHPETDEEAEDMVTANVTVSSASSVPVSSSHILIVDDEPVNRQVLVNHLTLQNYHIYEAAGGEEALEQVFGDQEFDLILLDVMMPRVSGFEVSKRIRQRLSMRRLPIIFLTARNQVADLVAGFEAGGNDFLTKPIQKAELLTRVKTHLELLDFHRSLENKVAERTRELQRKNLVLDMHNQELETLDNIVKTINREVEFRKVIQALLKQGMTLFPKADKSLYLDYDKKNLVYRPLAAVGHEMEIIGEVTLTQRQVFSLAEHIEEVGTGLYLASGIRSPDHTDGYETPRSTIVMSLVLGSEIQGFLMLDSMVHDDVFQSPDIKKLDRFREHAVSAVAKARVLEDLVAAQRRLMETAHMAGRAEIATDVLHNVGNILNSISTSVHLVMEHVTDRKAVNFFQKALGLLDEHRDNLGEFLDSDPRGSRVPEYLHKVLHSMDKQQVKLEKECLRLTAHIRNIERVLREQQRHTHAMGWLVEPHDLNLVVTEVLEDETALVKDRDVELVLDLGEVSRVMVEKAKLKRVLAFLLQNAAEAVEQVKEKHEGRIVLATWEDERGIFCEIRDNGVGIAEHELEQIFVQGFSTKPGSQGYGLHYCANAMT
ncbi:MAG: two-component regulator propeller domain-containing protein, partial [Acidobacteriota bacterium]|nr:two-component regulator propeller domain-containing protein [Acidobacteriota bacterium]